MESLNKSIALTALAFAITSGFSQGHAQQPFPDNVSFSEFSDEAGPLETQSTPKKIRCGTMVDFVADNALAFAEAKRTGKLVYMLHLSGNLKNENFT